MGEEKERGGRGGEEECVMTLRRPTSSASAFSIARSVWTRMCAG